MGLLLFGEVRGIDSAKRRVQAVISTAAVARDGAVIEPRGWRFEHYDRNPVVLWNHDTAQLPIARAVPGERMVTEREARALCAGAQVVRAGNQDQLARAEHLEQL
ncbi:MAG: hypothetical protein KatS3mg064_2557 [Tepidiforma sp.]|nr:hypothetical protein [Tepidiforma sp.]GIW19400.1 MAG: hypothetical protein KatS3mg064_2557 [Tepidiforma sp.]